MAKKQAETVREQALADIAVGMSTDVRAGLAKMFPKAEVTKGERTDVKTGTTLTLQSRNVDSLLGKGYFLPTRPGYYWAVEIDNVNVAVLVQINGTRPATQGEDEMPF